MLIWLAGNCEWTTRCSGKLGSCGSCRQKQLEVGALYRSRPSRFSHFEDVGVLGEEVVQLRAAEAGGAGEHLGGQTADLVAQVAADSDLRHGR